MENYLQASRRGLLMGSVIGLTLLSQTSFANSPKKKPILAPTPPMGWNSWNSFATTINEEQALDNAKIMAQKLLPFGYDIFTIDIQWYEPNAKSYEYNKNPIPQIDEFGRLIPANNRFPSSVGNNGFKHIANEIHKLGLKFGIHVMRGIPRYAVEKNLPILNTKYHARDIANVNSICPWNPDMFGVDMTKAGAQEYYNSIFSLYASWGVDFVKMDDMSRPYDSHALEIEAAHKAILNTKRPIILSLSPGETPVARGLHVAKYAQMWRISDDFWDEWHLLKDQFTRLENWNQYRAKGAWPDADMLPLGRLALGERDTKFTKDEQYTLMSLWAIARSPLIMGGDLRHLDDFTLNLLTNRDIIEINQNTYDNRPHFIADDIKIWTAKSEKTRNKSYIAIFNTSNVAKEIMLPLKEVGIIGARNIVNIWNQDDSIGVGDKVKAIIAPHGVKLYKLLA